MAKEMISELRHKDGTPMRKYNSPKLQEIEMENKQTAVEWIIDQLRQLSHSLEAHLGMGDIRVTQGMIDDFEEQAKQMEKRQILDALETGWVMGCRKDAAKVLHTEQYYNETYGK